MIKSLFCSHDYEVKSEHIVNEVKLVEMKYGSGMFEYHSPATTFWGEPIVHNLPEKRVLLCCKKCGKIRTETI